MLQPLGLPDVSQMRHASSMPSPALRCPPAPSSCRKCTRVSRSSYLRDTAFARTCPASGAAQACAVGTGPRPRAAGALCGSGERAGAEALRASRWRTPASRILLPRRLGNGEGLPSDGLPGGSWTSPAVTLPSSSSRTPPRPARRPRPPEEVLMAPVAFRRKPRLVWVRAWN